MTILIIIMIFTFLFKQKQKLHLVVFLNKFNEASGYNFNQKKSAIDF